MRLFFPFYSVLGITFNRLVSPLLLFPGIPEGASKRIYNGWTGMGRGLSVRVLQQWQTLQLRLDLIALWCFVLALPLSFFLFSFSFFSESELYGLRGRIHITLSPFASLLETICCTPETPPKEKQKTGQEWPRERRRRVLPFASPCGKGGRTSWALSSLSPSLYPGLGSSGGPVWEGNKKGGKRLRAKTTLHRCLTLVVLSNS